MTAENHMRLCFDLAEKAKGHTAPNPMVGAVLVYEDRIIGQGWHHFYGADHAEVNCLENVADSDKHLIPESTMYVSLEPCAHQGITPSCARRLVTERVKKVVISNTDPFDKVSGEGIRILEQAGIAVENGLLEPGGLWLNRRFFCFHQRKRPYIILKWAETADGYLAPADRSRLQITGPGSQALLHQWRTEEGAIMVGHTTALKDDPRLTARLHAGKQPLRIALDRRLSLPRTHHLFDDAAATWIINELRETLEGDVHHVRLAFDDTLLPRLLERLREARILSIIIEGGAVLLNSFIAMGLWDEARVFTGDNSLGSGGVVAPKLQDEKEAFHRSVGVDTLRLYVNKNSAYQYIPGMDL